MSRWRETSWGLSHSSVYSDRKVGLCKVQCGAHAAHRCACASRSHRLLCSSSHERANEAPSVETEVEVKEGFEEEKSPEKLFQDEARPVFGPKIKDESLFMSVVDIAKKRRGQDLRQFDSKQYTVMKPLCDYIVIASYRSRYVQHHTEMFLHDVFSYGIRCLLLKVEGRGDVETRVVTNWQQDRAVS